VISAEPKWPLSVARVWALTPGEMQAAFARIGTEGLGSRQVIRPDRPTPVKRRPNAYAK
jgi:hypothetical protein